MADSPSVNAGNGDLARPRRTSMLQRAKSNTLASRGHHTHFPRFHKFSMVSSELERDGRAGAGRIKVSATLLGVIAAFSAISVGPHFTAPGYSSVTNAISELGAQATRNAWIMNAGFVAYGFGVLVDAVRRLRTAPFVAVAFIVFGLAMIMNALFSHRPIDHSIPYDVRADGLHSLSATVVGFSFTFGAVAQSFIERGRWRRLSCYGAAVTAIVLPLGMLQFPEIQGVLQRIMFGISFAWLVVFLPDTGTHARVPTRGNTR